MESTLESESLHSTESECIRTDSSEAGADFPNTSAAETHDQQSARIPLDMSSEDAYKDV